MLPEVFPQISCIVQIAPKSRIPPVFSPKFPKNVGTEIFSPLSNPWCIVFFLISLIGISQKAFHGAQRPGDNVLSLDLRFRNHCTCNDVSIHSITIFRCIFNFLLQFFIKRSWFTYHMKFSSYMRGCVPNLKKLPIRFWHRDIWYLAVMSQKISLKCLQKRFE